MELLDVQAMFRLVKFAVTDPYEFHGTGSHRNVNAFSARLNRSIS